VDDLFDPVAGHWTRVAPQLATVRRILLLVPAAMVGVAGLVVALLTGLTTWVAVVGWALVAVSLGVAGWGWTWAGRNQRSWGYAENDDDLLVTCGVMFKRLVAIPYGRMQFVDVQAGPLERAFGIATVTLHTASTETAADIPGLRADEATRLRNRLTELGEAHGAGV
jgi:membrane protein YdbS with pleckstrin-like domain